MFILFLPSQKTEPILTILLKLSNIDDMFRLSPWADDNWFELYSPNHLLDDCSKKNYLWKRMQIRNCKIRRQQKWCLTCWSLCRVARECVQDECWRQTNKCNRTRLSGIYMVQIQIHDKIQILQQIQIIRLIRILIIWLVVEDCAEARPIDATAVSRMRISHNLIE